MSDYREILKDLRHRMIFAGPLLIAAFLCPVFAGGYGLLLSLPLGGVAAIILFPVISELLAEPIRDLIYPTERFDKPQPMYGIPAARRAKGAYEEALAAYEDLIVKYPDEIRPWFGLIEIAAVDLKNPDRTLGYLARALVAFPKPEDQALLRDAFKANSSRINPNPKWLEEQLGRTLMTKPVAAGAIVDEPDGLTARRFHPGGYNVK